MDVKPAELVIFAEEPVDTLLPPGDSGSKGSAAGPAAGVRLA